MASNGRQLVNGSYLAASRYYSQRASQGTLRDSSTDVELQGSRQTMAPVPIGNTQGLSMNDNKLGEGLIPGDALPQFINPSLLVREFL